MFGSKKRRIADLEARVAQLAEQRDQARGDRDTEREARRIVTGHYCEADGALRRLHGRNLRLAELLELAREAQGNAEHEQLHTRLHVALRGCARYRAEIAAQHRVVDQLTTQLFNALGYDHAGLRALGAEVLDHQEVA